MRRGVLLGLLLAAIALVVVGCGDSNKSDSGTAYKAPSADSNVQATKVVRVSTKSNGDLGTILAGDNGKTLYMFEADKNGKSACDGACAAAWPPVTTSGSPQASGDAKSSALTLVRRSDGMKQVAYMGHPLYYFVKDTDAQDALGEESDAFGAEWYAVTPSGTKAEKEGSSSNEQDGSSQGDAGGY